MDNKSIIYCIEKALCRLTEEEGQRYEKQANIVSWNGASPVLDIRTWERQSDGSLSPLKGITLSRREAERLKTLLDVILKPPKPSNDGEKKEEGEKEKPEKGENVDDGKQADG